MNQILCDVRDGASYKMNERVNAYFKGDWLEKYLLGNEV